MKIRASGWCRKHYGRWERHSDPLHGQYLDRLGAVETGLYVDPGPCHIVEFQEGRRPDVQYQGTALNASRYVWIKAHGDPGDLWVLHTCGNGVQGCVNIHHLYVGTAAHNSRDRLKDGTHGRGEQCTAAQLTDQQANDIRRRYVGGGVASGGNSDDLATEYGVARNVIWGIGTGRTYNPVPV